MKIEINGGLIHGTFTAEEFPLFRKMVTCLTDRKYRIHNDGDGSGKIRAIKAVRSGTTVKTGLLEAKQAVEGTRDLTLTAFEASRLSKELPAHGYRLEELD